MKNIKWNYVLVGFVVLVGGLVAAMAINRKIEKKLVEKMVANGDAIIENGQTASGQAMTSLKAV
ncbi:MAG: hypothetical protein HRU41_40760 [Saprospiraceae bacterium]|nr:hypothetical protein [Saprospiraceae bacterium]